MFKRLKERVGLLEKGELQDLINMKRISDRVSQLETKQNLINDNILRIFDYLQAHLELVDDKIQLVDDCYCCDCCGKDLTPLDTVINLIDELDDKDKKEIKKYLK